MKVTLELYWMSAKTTEIAMNTTISSRMVSTCCFSFISLASVSLMKSSVSVELDASTSEDSVDIEAESTRMTTTAIRNEESPSSMVGMMES